MPKPVPLRLAGAALVVLLFGLPLFHGLGARDFETDEAIYAGVVERMAATGEWLTLRDFRGAPFLEKPPLKFWIVAAGLRSGWLGTDESAFRFWDPILATLAFLYVFALGCRLEGALCGLAAVFFLFLNGPLVVWHGLRANTMEALLVLAYCGGMYHFLAWSDATHRSRGRAHLAALGFWFACGFLTKFVAVLFLPLVVAATLFWSADARAKATEDRRGWALAGLVAAMVSLPWFAQQTFAHGPLFWDTLLGQHVIRRFTDGVDPSHLQGWSYYLERLWSSLTETVLIIVPGVALWLARALGGAWIGGRAVLLWWALPLLALSLASSKLYWYCYPFLPPLGLFGGYAVSRLARAGAGVLKTSPWRSSRALRALCGLGAVVAWTIALFTAVSGPVRFEWGLLFFSSSTLERPTLVASLLTMIALSRVGLAVGVLAAAAVASGSLPSYLGVWKQMGQAEHSTSRLAACLGRRADGLWLLEGTRVQPQPDYYLRRSGVARHAIVRESIDSRGAPPPPAHLAILANRDDLAALGRLPWWRQRLAEASVVGSPDSLLILNGANRACAAGPHGARGPFIAR